MEFDHLIERAKTGRAACRSCKIKIEKSELRLALEVLKRPEVSDAMDTTRHFYHLKCAAKAHPEALNGAMQKFDGEIPQADEIREIMQARAKPSGGAPGRFPYAERSPSARAKCISCSEKIEKDELRVVVEREIDTPHFSGKSKGYLHLGCAPAAIGAEDFISQLEKNSSLNADDLAALQQALT